MTDKKISDLSASGAIAGADLLELVQSGTNVKGTASQFLDRTAHTGAQAISTVTGLQAAIDLKADLAGPTFTGVPAAPTASAATSTTQLATTAFATTADNLKANLASPTFTGTANFATLAYSGFAVCVASTQVDSSTAVTVTATSGVARIRLTGNATITLPTAPTLATDGRTVLEVELLQDATGSRTVTWAAQGGDTIAWDSSSTAPSIQTTASKETHFVFRRRQGSTVWRASKTWQEV